MMQFVGSRIDVGDEDEEGDESEWRDPDVDQCTADEWSYDIS